MKFAVRTWTESRAWRTICKASRRSIGLTRTRQTHTRHVYIYTYTHTHTHTHIEDEIGRANVDREPRLRYDL